MGTISVIIIVFLKSYIHNNPPTMTLETSTKTTIDPLTNSTLGSMSIGSENKKWEIQESLNARGLPDESSDFIDPTTGNIDLAVLEKLSPVQIQTIIKKLPQYKIESLIKELPPDSPLVPQLQAALDFNATKTAINTAPWVDPNGTIAVQALSEYVPRMLSWILEYSTLIAHDLNTETWINASGMAEKKALSMEVAKTAAYVADLRTKISNA